MLKFGALGMAGLGTLASLRANEYDLGSIGAMRLGRAALTVLTIGQYYQKHLYANNNNNEGEQLSEQEKRQIAKSKCHEFGAQKLLQLCCANKGVFIKVGQHIGT